MSEELFDVVDEHDEVIDQAQRSVVHANGWRHRAVHIFLFRSNGDLLIHRRAADKEEFPDVWTSSASGHVSSGEDYDVAASREVAEELGVSPQLTRLGKFTACPDTCMEHTVLYRAFSDDAIRFDAREISAVQWLPPTEIAERIAGDPGEYSPAFRLLFSWYRTQ